MHKQLPYQIFISYRRNGSDAHARVFYEKLKEKGYSVFLDFESLFSGGFKKNISKAVNECEDFILLIPDGGLDRCAEEEDLLRYEIKLALEGNKNIIPIFINGFKMPDAKDLPEDIAALSDENGIECSMEYFDAVFERLLKNLNSQPSDDYIYETLEYIRKKLLSVEHDYFKKWACMKINDFLLENEEFFEGTNWTNPHAEDTFGVSGIEFTKKSVKAITAVSDYWQDNFTIEYLKKQADIIKSGAVIQRVFVLEDNGLENAVAQMDYQYKLGIEVYYIEKNNGYIDPEWLEEDYLIQDETLLVQIFCDTHQFTSQNKNNEQITMESVKVRKKIERFQRILERATKYDPDSFTLKQTEHKA